jgi:hypothetical protein
MNLLKIFCISMLLCTTGMAQINEYGLKLGITNTKFEYQNKNKNLDILGKYGQSIFVNAYAQVYKKEYTSVQIGLGYLERASTMPFRVPITIGSITDSITLNQNWAIESTPYQCAMQATYHSTSPSSFLMPSTSVWRP